MKRLIAVALATLFVAGICANAAVADDRVQLNGEMRVRAWNISVADDDDLSYFDQRLRVGTTINVADGVKVISRMDFAEDMWGSDNWTGVRFDNNSELQVDRAYLQVDKGIIGVSAGQQLITLGNAIAYDNNGTGIKLSIKTPVVITLGYTKESENGSAYDEEADDTDDIDTYLVNVGYATDMFSVNAFYATAVDGNEDGFEPNVIGLQGTVVAGILSFNAEVDIFGGDVSGVDVMGTQFWGNVEAAVLDNLKIGVDLVWSDGNDTDDEIKITALNDWTDWTVMDRGPFNTDITPGGTSDVMDPVPFGTVVGPELVDAALAAAGINMESAEYGAQAGAIGGGLYAIFTPMEGLDLFAQFMYLSAEEDEFVGTSADSLWDDAMVYSLGASWTFAPNTAIAAQYHKTDWNSEYDELDDSVDVVVARLAVNF